MHAPSMPSNPAYPLAAKPKREIFDPWNSSSTGHQRAENRLAGSTSWRDSRSAKLAEQFRSGAGGGKRVADTVGGGSESFERGDRTANGGWKRGVVRDREGGQVSLWESFGVRKKGARAEDKAETIGVGKETEEWRLPPELPYERFQLESVVRNEDAKARPVTPPPPEGSRKRKRGGTESREEESISVTSPAFGLETVYSPSITSGDPSSSSAGNTQSTQGSQSKASVLPASASGMSTQPLVEGPPQATTSQLFRNLTFYINGSTYPLISDHKLKHLLVQHGGHISIVLGRRSVTHVILGRSNVLGQIRSEEGEAEEGVLSNQAHAQGRLAKEKGSGGALAARKIQKEVERVKTVGGQGVKYVGVEWVLDSVSAGKRVPEHKYEAVATMPAGVKGVAKMFGRKDAG